MLKMLVKNEMWKRNPLWLIKVRVEQYTLLLERKAHINK